MKKIFFLALSLLATTVMVAQSSEDLMQRDLFSNYGGWKNLTAGYVRDSTDADPIKSEVAISGNTVHLVFADRQSKYHEQPEGYAVWYRRSTDGGVTWEDARSLYQRRNETWNGYFNIMQVEGQHVHMVIPDRKSSENDNPTNTMLVYLHSSDGGATFTTLVVDTLEQSYYHHDAAVLRVDGNNIVIAASENVSSYSRLVMYRSTDGGASFERLDVSLPKGVSILGDLQLKGNQWIVAWSYTGYQDEGVYVTTGNMTGATPATTLISPEIDGRHYGAIRKQYGGNGSDFNFSPVMAITGTKTVHLIFQGLRAKGEEDGDPYRTLYIRSEDFGQTWGDIHKLEETRDQNAMLVAKGQNVYAIVGNNYNRWIAYSNDGGDTWKRNTTMCYGSTYGSNYDSPRAYTLVLDPNDPTGLHAWYLGSKWLDIETKDGFQTLSRCHRAEGDLYSTTANRGSQFSPMLAIDGQGTRHLFMRQPVGGDRNVQQIFYRKEVSEPASKGKIMALHMHESNDSSRIQRRIAIPLDDSFVLDSALSYGCWVRVDQFGGAQLLSYRQNTPNTSGEYQEASVYSPGFYLTFSNPYRSDRMYFEAGITTDQAVDGRGTRVTYWEYNDQYAYMARHTGLWHYVAFTWDGRIKGANAALYVDGYKIATASVVGALERGTNPLIIGNQNKNDNDWYMDELRIFNRALSQDEVEALSRNEKVDETGCLVHYGFDGTLKDLSGHGNDGLAELDCDFAEYEGLLLPKPKMQISKDLTGRVVTFTDQTENGQAYYWFFNDQRSGYTHYGDTIRHPQYRYEPGNYKPVLIARGANACASVSQQIIIAGLNKVEPAVAGQAEGVNLKIYGGYEWKNNLNVRLHREGKEDIIGAWLKRDGYGKEENLSPSEKLHYATFDLSKAELGAWDVIVGEDTLKQAFTVEPFRMPDVWAELTGWNKMLINKSKDFYIEYGNRGNVDAYNVPCVLYVAADAEVTLGFENPLYSPQISDPVVKETLDTMQSIVFDAGAPYGKLRAFPLLLPRVAAGGHYRLPFFVKSDKDVDMYLFVSEPWGPLAFDENGNLIVAEEPEEQANAMRRMPQDEWTNIEKANTRKLYNSRSDCVMKYLGWGTIDATVGSVPLLGCAYQVGLKMWIQAIEDNPEDRIGNFMTNVFSAAFVCSMDLNPIGWPFRGIFFANSLFNIMMNIDAMYDCMTGNGFIKRVLCVNSYDPNEMIGPDGFGNEHFIKPAPEMSYTITFENKSTATAPAHEVFVYDTLDTNTYDLDAFGFSSFGWADTIIRVDGQNMKEFTQDVKLANQQIIVRVTGKLNVEKGVASWSFITLDKNGKLEEDPDKGFLVPNNASHAGEGFVTFAINHKGDLGNGAKIANEATIIFDANDPIKTNKYVNTIDKDVPESKASKVTLKDNKLDVEYTAQDATSGIRKVQVYVSVNKGAFEPMEGTSIAYDPAKTYCFATIAVDNVGWKENKDVADLTCETNYEPEDKPDQGIDNVNLKSEIINHKFIKDNHLFILRNGKTYTAQGQEVK